MAPRIASPGCALVAVKRALSLAAALVLGAASPAHAPRPSDAFLTPDIDGEQLRGQWEIVLRDLAVVVDLDADRDRAITWGELSSARPAIDAAVAGALALAADGRACSLHAGDLQIDDRVEGRFAWIGLEG